MRKTWRPSMAILPVAIGLPHNASLTVSRGTAGMLGLVTLASIAADLESLLKEEQALAEHNELLGQVSADLKTAWNALLAVLPAAQPGEVPERS
jgi:hypothetical protein